MAKAWLANRFEDWVFRETLRMNEQGLPVDIPLVKSTIKYIEAHNKKLVDEFLALTGGVTPTQVQKVKEWFATQGLDVVSLERVGLERMLKQDDLSDELRRVIEIRMALGRVSTKKLYSILKLDSGDGWVRGSFIYHGAGPGRFTATSFQPHNLQRPTIKNVDRVIELLEEENYTALEAEFEDVMEAIGSAMRGFIKAPEGYLLVRADYNAIEARVLAWLAGEDELVEAFHAGRDIYCGMASTIFGIDEDVIKAGHKDDVLEYSEMRKLGKDTILGCGYSMWVNTFLCQIENKGNDKIAGIPIRLNLALIGQRDEETFNPDVWDLAYTAVTSYRNKYRRIVALWKQMEKMAVMAIQNPGKSYQVQNRKIIFRYDNDTLTMKLPSGRRICYPKARVKMEEWYNGKEKISISYMAVSDRGTWRWEKLYGGKIVENAVQAIARDLMVWGMWQASKHGFINIGTVHDEILALCEKVMAKARLARKFETIICNMPWWARGDSLATTIPLTAEGKVSLRYGK
jgi:DNA polymerase